MNNVTQIDEYRPNYERQCENCEQTPVVEGIKDGKVVYCGTMCGPCTWGEAKTLDPATWNQS